MPVHQTQGHRWGSRTIIFYKRGIQKSINDWLRINESSTESGGDEKIALARGSTYIPCFCLWRQNPENWASRIDGHWWNWTTTVFKTLRNVYLWETRSVEQRWEFRSVKNGGFPTELTQKSGKDTSLIPTSARYSRTCGTFTVRTAIRTTVGAIGE